MQVYKEKHHELSFICRCTYAKKKKKIWGDLEPIHQNKIAKGHILTLSNLPLMPIKLLQFKPLEIFSPEMRKSVACEEIAGKDC